MKLPVFYAKGNTRIVFLSDISLIAVLSMEKNESIEAVECRIVDELNKEFKGYEYSGVETVANQVAHVWVKSNINS